MSTIAPDLKCKSCGAIVPQGNTYCGACGAKLQPIDEAVEDHLLGEVIDERFRLLEILGAGGMGTIYLAEHVGIGKRVAVKLLRADLRGQPTLVHRLRREAMAVSKLTDIHTINVFDFGIWNGLVYLVMEYLQGEDLASVLSRERRVSVPRALRIARQVCSSLAEAHAVGVVHRDLKPENIFMTRSTSGDELVKVLDFGLAKILNPQDRPEVMFETQDGALLGTPYFMSPEQVLGEAIDARTDIYALGALMYRMLTGLVPFRGKTPMEVLEGHVSGRLKAFAEVATGLDVSSEVEDFVRQLMSRNPKKRPATAMSVEKALAELSGGPTTGSAPVVVPDDEVSAEFLVTTESPPPSGMALRFERAVSTQLNLGELPTQDDPSGPGDLGDVTGETSSPYGGIEAAPSDPGFSMGEDGESLPADLGRLAQRHHADLYARRLARKRRVRLVMLLLLLSGAIGGTYYYVEVLGGIPLTKEVEPNDETHQANVLRPEHPIKGFIGRRSKSDRSDRDFYSIEIPEGKEQINVRLSGVPTLDLVLDGYTYGGKRLAKGDNGRAGEGESITLPVGKEKRILVAVREVWVKGVAPLENSTDAYTLEVDFSLQAQPSSPQPASSPMGGSKTGPEKP